MKNKIIDLLLKMKSGDHCIGTTADKILDLHGIKEEDSLNWTNNDIDAAYLMGCINTGDIDSVIKELERFKKLGINPYEAVSKIRRKSEKQCKYNN